MAAGGGVGGDYYHNYDGYCWGGNRRREEQEGGPPLPLHLCFLVCIVFLFLTVSWYLSYESAVESLLDQLKLVLVLSPLVLLLAVHWLSGAEPGRLPLLLPLPPDRHSLHRAGGSPWGVALLLLLLLLMLSYQPSFQRRWFPLLGGR